MRFEDAVRALQKGKCEFIESENGSWYMLLNNNLYTKNECSVILSTFEIYGNWELVNPVKEFEEVGIVRYYCNDCKQSQSSEGECCNEKLIKLTGTIKKEIKPKVNKREEVEQLFLGNMAGPLSAPYRYKGRNVKLFAEWEE